MTLNRTPSQWGLYTSGKALDDLVEVDDISPNVALAFTADDLNMHFEALSKRKAWTEVTQEHIAIILNGYADLGAADSEGFDCATSLLIALYGLTGQDAKVAFCQFRYPAPTEEDEEFIANMRAIINGDEEVK
jgi:hypothetical protein